MESLDFSVRKCYQLRPSRSRVNLANRGCRFHGDRQEQVCGVRQLPRGVHDGGHHPDADGKSVVNQDECVECSTCYRVLRDERAWAPFIRAVRKGLSLFRLGYLADPDICPTGALTPPKLEWPRLVRAEFSDPQLPHSSTGGRGRGMEEMKTNDVTGRLRNGVAGLVVELGRPGTGEYFRDIERVAMALARLPISFEADNPVTHISGLLEGAQACCHKAGIAGHSAVIAETPDLEKNGGGTQNPITASTPPRSRRSSCAGIRSWTRPPAPRRPPPACNPSSASTTTPRWR